VTGRAGLPLVLEMLRALGLDQGIAEHVKLRERASGYTETEKIEALVLLLAAGGDCLDDSAVLHADRGLGRLLGRRLPSADRLRHLLYACHAEALIAQAQAQRPAGQRPSASPASSPPASGSPSSRRPSPRAKRLLPRPGPPSETATSGRGPSSSSGGPCPSDCATAVC